MWAAAFPFPEGPDKTGPEAQRKVMTWSSPLTEYRSGQRLGKRPPTNCTLVIDRSKLMEPGYTVAQLYADLASGLSTEANATALTIEAPT